MRARDALRLSHVPGSTRHRESEYESILRFFQGRLSRREGGSLYVCGAPGTGKTLHVEKARDAACGALEASGDAVVATLRGTSFTSAESFARAVGRSLVPEESWSALSQKECLRLLGATCAKGGAAGEPKKRKRKKGSGVASRVVTSNSSLPAPR